MWPRSAWSVVQLIGANCAFVANPARSLIVMLALLQWKERNDAVKLSSEAPFESFVTPVRYVRCAPRLQIVLARDVLFNLSTSSDRRLRLARQ
jgi:hypothetical protein